MPIVHDLRVDAIVVGERLRPLSMTAVDELSAAMAEEGLINPITVHRLGGNNPRLVAGLHRLAAAKRLGWETIACHLLPISTSADDCKLIEIDENLARAELSPAARAIHIAERKAIYLRKHPETKHGAAPGKAGGGKRTKEEKSASFADDTAAKSGRTARSIRADSTRAKNIPHIADAIGTSLDKGEELDALAKLPEIKQAEIIADAKAGKKVSAKTAVKQIQREAKEAELSVRIAAGPASLDGSTRYAVVLADPPWQFHLYGGRVGGDRSAENHYPTMTLADIEALPVPAADDCVLFLWATVPMLPQALSVMRAWGFTYKSQIVWVKDRIGTGYWTRNKHELLLIGTRGGIPAPAMGTQPESAILAPLSRHSEKPAVFHEIIEGMFPTLPKLEMFARANRPGWQTWGAEAPALEAAE